MERLVGVGKICMEKRRCSQTEQGQYYCDDARLITCNDEKTTADLDSNSSGVRQRCGQWEHGGCDEPDRRAVGREFTQAAHHERQADEEATSEGKIAGDIQGGGSGAV